MGHLDSDVEDLIDDGKFDSKITRYIKPGFIGFKIVTEFICTCMGLWLILDPMFKSYLTLAHTYVGPFTLIVFAFAYLCLCLIDVIPQRMKKLKTTRAGKAFFKGILILQFGSLVSLVIYQTENAEISHRIHEGIVFDFTGDLAATDSFTYHLHNFQMEAECCGVTDGLLDYRNVTGWNMTSMFDEMGLNDTDVQWIVPASCCMVPNAPLSESCVLDPRSSNAHLDGCWEEMMRMNTVVISVLGFALACVSIQFLMVFVFTFVDGYLGYVGRSSKDTAAGGH